MRKPFLYATLALIAIAIYGLSLNPTREPIRWAAYYDHALPPKAFSHLDLVIFDREHHPDLNPLKGRTLLFAYISIGEVRDGSPDAAWLKKNKLLIDINKRWKSHVVDITAPEWQALVLDHVKDAFFQGFDGVMLDTVDSPIHWAETNKPEQTEAVMDAAETIIQSIHKNYPQMKIILNRGFSLLPRVAADIDYVLAESIFTHTEVSTGQFKQVSPMTYAKVAKQLQGVTAVSPRLQILTLDYWDTQDVNGLERIYVAQRAHGFSPYVTSPDLRTLTPLPDISTETH